MTIILGLIILGVPLYFSFTLIPKCPNIWVAIVLTVICLAIEIIAKASEPKK